MRNYLLLTYLSLISALACGPTAPPLEDQLLGFWTDTLHHNEQSTLVHMEFYLGEEGDTLCKVMIPTIRAEMAFGPVSMHQDSITYQYLPDFSLHYDQQGQTLRGMVPSAILPVYQVDLSLIKSVRPEAEEQQSSPDTRSPSWSFETGGPIWSTPVVAGEQLFFGSNDSTLYALDLTDRSLSWQMKTGGEIRSKPLVAGDYVYCLADDGILYKLHKTDGNLAWKFAATAAPREEDKTYLHYSSSPILHNGLLYFGTLAGDIFAVQAADGAERWRFNTGGAIAAAGLFADGNVFFGSYDGHIYALDATTGELVWKYDTSSPVVSRPVKHKDHIIVGSRSYDLPALNAASGEVDWKYYYWFSWVESSGVIEQDTLYIGSSDAAALFAIDPARGKVLWQSLLGGWALATPVLDDKAVYMGTVGTHAYIAPHTGAVCAVNRNTGQINWKYTATPTESGHYGFGGGAVIAGDYLYIGSLDGGIYGFKM